MSSKTKKILFATIAAALTALAAWFTAQSGSPDAVETKIFGTAEVESSK